MDIQEADGDASVVDNSSEAVAQAKNDVLRPLDKFMRPLKETLQLKSSLYKEPDTAEEQAVLQLEQAKEAKEGKQGQAANSTQHADHSMQHTARSKCSTPQAASSQHQQASSNRQAASRKQHAVRDSK